ncbi:MAG TPA: OsmC family protein [Catalimonadaceae bacterium]|nr:OsmC family protein [Catalimonadaceae bacterium]HPI09833.1 OsmC family protein [Catalimonadaceae bacterium]
MATATGKYLGGLRTEVRHSASGQSFITDAPVDNNGKGEAFSPTDTVCAALSSCMMTLMGIYAERENIDLKGMHSTITKHMAANPRRISKIEIVFVWPEPEATDHQKEMLRRAALTCPVASSLHPDIEQVITFNF